MNLYNKIMLYFWLVAAILIAVIVTVMGFVDGFDVWGYYYVLAGLATMAYLSRRFMMKRFEKAHQEFYGDKSEENKD